MNTKRQSNPKISEDGKILLAIALAIGLFSITLTMIADNCTKNSGAYWASGTCASLADSYGTCPQPTSTGCSGSVDHTTYDDVYSCSGTTYNSCCKGINDGGSPRHRTQTAPCVPQGTSACVPGSYGDWEFGMMVLMGPATKT